MVAYCDGGAFTGDVERVDPATNLHSRGARIFSAVMEDLLSKGLKDAKWSAKALPKSCTSRMKPELSWVSKLCTGVGTTLGDYYNAITHILQYATQKKNLRERLEFLTKLPNASDPKSRGAFIDSQFQPYSTSRVVESTECQCGE
ncbi:hypothetical protein HAX54_030869 [Datura stramonium]|uniref:Pectin acetylesterase n=1 Tax=Datura stramonium TaxID=4076 RepID=A0ABS8SBJ1_DATST|nr:hypothetical protein [Datura stramonium]